MPNNVLVIQQKVAGNKYLRAAVEQIPQYVDAVTLRKAALARQQSLPGMRWPDPPGIPDDLDAFLAGVAEADAAERARTVQYNALANVVTRCNSAIEGVLWANADQLPRSLNGDLRQLFTDVDAAVARLRGANTDPVRRW
jgi:hypothetical protein